MVYVCYLLLDLCFGVSFSLLVLPAALLEVGEPATSFLFVLGCLFCCLFLNDRRSTAIVTTAITTAIRF